MSDLTVRLVLSADGAPLRAEVMGAGRSVQQFAAEVQRSGVTVERVAQTAEGGFRRLGDAAQTMGQRASTAIGGQAVSALRQMEGRLLAASRGATGVLVQLGALPGQFGALATAGSTAAAALSGGLAGVAVQLGVLAAQWLLVGRAAETTQDQERRYREGTDAINAVLLTRAQRARAAAEATLALARATATERLEAARAGVARLQREDPAIAALEGGAADPTLMGAFQTPAERAAQAAGLRLIQERRRLTAEARAEMAQAERDLAEAEERLRRVNETGLTNLLEGGGGAAGGGRNPVLTALDRQREEAERHAERIRQAIRSPMEVYREELGRLEGHLASGRLTQEEFTRAVERAKDALRRAGDQARETGDNTDRLEGLFARLGEQLDGFGREAAKSLADALLGVNRLQGGVMALIQRLASGILAKLIEEQITTPLVRAASAALQGFGGGGGILGSLLGAIGIGGGGSAATVLPGVGGPKVVGGFHAGGMAGGRPTFTRAIPADLFGAMFREAPRFHTGTGPVLGAGEVPAILRRGEGVFTPEQMAAMAPAAPVTIQVIDQRGSGAPPVEMSESRGPDGERVIRAIIRAETGRAIRDGAFDRDMGLAFGLRRAGLR